MFSNTNALSRDRRTGRCFDYRLRQRFYEQAGWLLGGRRLLESAFSALALAFQTKIIKVGALLQPFGALLQPSPNNQYNFFILNGAARVCGMLIQVPDTHMRVTNPCLSMYDGFGVV